MTTRHPAFQNPQQPPTLDHSPNALTPEEVQIIQDRLQAGQAPRTKLIRKMLRIALQSSSAYQAGVAWASGKVTPTVETGLSPNRDNSVRAGSVGG
jgi:hypothetical protein